MTLSLFPEQPLGPAAVVLRGFAVDSAPRLLSDIEAVAARAPFRHWITPGGFRMSAGMTNTGELGWVSEPKGYRYDPIDPQSGEPWPPMPASFLRLAAAAAERAGFSAFVPDACLVNRYVPGAKLSLHQDRDERDFTQPIVSVSLGLPATFLWGGDTRAERPVRVPLEHGDVVVWGGPDRLRFHGVSPLAEGEHPLTGAHRINLTFRRAS